MILSLSHGEAVNLIRDHFNLPANVEITIGRKANGGRGNNVRPSNPFEGIPSDIEKALRSIHALSVSNQKIPAIKEFRNRFGSGLKEAKDAVEQWDRLLDDIRHCGRLPRWAGGY